MNMKIVYLDTVIRKTSFTVTGEPASKSNSRKIVKFGRRMALIKSAKARDYVKSFNHQIKKIEPLMTGDLVVEMTIWYATRRPDLDESVILDCMQGVIYENDRQVKEKHIYHGLDKENPRAEISVWLKEKAPSEVNVTRGLVSPHGEERQQRHDSTIHLGDNFNERQRIF